ncbi:uncharacterized protein LOC101857002 [Aplysia californica]|uniref:Mitochondria-eating protein n=1 Tax=Aplysia californica TaxID=6500 RepID=A0ABM1W4S5_APLCA|nr:uncharacterized protein LOC101857002 [Aplysia californica]XP_035829669.1 uncharacterized protein LOC101857002 [Aplysia californica]
MSGENKKDLHSEARSFSANLSTVFLLKRRDPQTKHLLEKAQHLIDGLLAESARPAPATPTARSSRGGAGMGQLWVKLDELKRENDDLKRQRGRSSDERAGSPKSPKSPKPQPGHTEAVSSDLLRARSENEALKQQVEKLQKSLKEHQSVHSTLQDEYKRSKAALEAAQKSAMRAREETKKMESSVKSMRTENESLKQKLSQANSHSSNNSPSKPAVSSPKPRPRVDNRMTENISEKSRPSNIAVAYTTLESQQWMDAKEGLEDLASEEDAVQFLCNLLVTSFKVNTHTLKCVEKVISHILSNPTAAVTLVDAGLDGQCSGQLPDDMSDLLGQKLRASYDKINTSEVAQMVKSRCDSSSPLLSEWSNPSLLRYVQECSSLTWQMVIQKPPMKLGSTDTRFDDAKHKLWWSCNQSKAKKINYVIWPVLYDYEGGNLMVKGCVHAS